MYGHKVVIGHCWQSPQCLTESSSLINKLIVQSSHQLTSLARAQSPGLYGPDTGQRYTCVRAHRAPDCVFICYVLQVSGVCIYNILAQGALAPVEPLLQ